MSDAKKAWGLLAEAIGEYAGNGMNHEKQKFNSKFKLQSAFENKSLSLISSATGEHGETFHAENSWIGFDITGSLNLYVVSNNHPAITTHAFHRIENGKDGEQKIVFRFGNPDDVNSFREEIHFSLFQDGSVEHFYSWGMPGGKFEPRSGARMIKV